MKKRLIFLTLTVTLALGLRAATLDHNIVFTSDLARQVLVLETKAQWLAKLGISIGTNEVTVANNPAPGDFVSTNAPGPNLVYIAIDADKGYWATPTASIGSDPTFSSVTITGAAPTVMGGDVYFPGITNLHLATDANGKLISAAAGTGGTGVVSSASTFWVTDPAYGAKGDGKRSHIWSLTAGSTTAVVTGAGFTAEDSGKSIVFCLATPANALTGFATSITNVLNSTTIQIALPATNNFTASVAPNYAVWGTDDTAAIQATMNACAAANGGKVKIPDGIFVIAGPIIQPTNEPVYGVWTNLNSQLYFPLIGLASSGITIELEGSTPWCFNLGSDSDWNGTVLFSTYTLTNYAKMLVNFNQKNVGYGSATDPLSVWFNMVRSTVRNIQFRGVPRTGLSMVDMSGGVTSYAENCFFDKLYSQAMIAAESAKPPITNTFGLRLSYPSNAGAGTVGARNCVVQGPFCYGIQFSEHALIEHCAVGGCMYAYWPYGEGHTMTVINCSAEECKYAFRGWAWDGEINVVSFSVESSYITPSWFYPPYLLDDNGALSGTIQYNYSSYGGGFSQELPFTNTLSDGGIAGQYIATTRIGKSIYPVFPATPNPKGFNITPPLAVLPCPPRQWYQANGYIADIFTVPFTCTLRYVNLPTVSPASGNIIITVYEVSDNIATSMASTGSVPYTDPAFHVAQFDLGTFVLKPGKKYAVMLTCDNTTAKFYLGFQAPQVSSTWLAAGGVNDFGTNGFTPLSPGTGYFLSGISLSDGSIGSPGAADAATSFVYASGSNNMNAVFGGNLYMGGLTNVPLATDASGKIIAGSAGTVTTADVNDSTNINQLRAIGVATYLPAGNLSITSSTPSLTLRTTGTNNTELDSKLTTRNLPFLPAAVPTFQPGGSLADQRIALDLMVKGSPTDRAGVGVAWIDVCDGNETSINAGNFEVTRVGKFVNGVGYISTGAGGTGTVRDLMLQYNGQRVGIGTTNINAAFPSSAKLVIVSAGSGLSLGYDDGHPALTINLTGDHHPIFYDYNSGAKSFMAVTNEIAYMSSVYATSMRATNGFLTQGSATATSLTAAATDEFIKVTATGQTITLPTAVGIGGKHYIIKLTASGTATVATTSSQNIDGATTYSLTAQYKYVHVVSDNAQWWIVGNN